MNDGQTSPPPVDFGDLADEKLIGLLLEQSDSQLPEGLPEELVARGGNLLEPLCEILLRQDRNLGAFLAEVGIDLIMCEIEPEVQTVVADVASTSIDEELDRLQEEADAFDGKQKPSTYTRRLEECQALRQRVVLYRDALGVGADRAARVLDELEQKVSSMLELRKQTVIHRDGTTTMPDAETPGVSSPGEPTSTRAHASLRFAGAQFTLADQLEPGVITFFSDDEAAKNAVAPLESMGLAGRWQQAGTVKIRIQNSGPPGAAVSLCIELPEGRTLTDSSASLAPWGIMLD